MNLPNANHPESVLPHLEHRCYESLLSIHEKPEALQDLIHHSVRQKVRIQWPSSNAEEAALVYLVRFVRILSPEKGGIFRVSLADKAPLDALLGSQDCLSKGEFGDWLGGIKMEVDGGMGVRYSEDYGEGWWRAVAMPL